MVMQERVYFSDNQITVSNLRVTFFGVTYPVNMIGSAVMREVKPYRSFGTGVCAFAIGFAGFIWALSQQGSYIGNFIMSCYLGAAALFALGFILRLAPTSYALEIERPSGKGKVLEDKDSKYIIKVINAINSAIVNK